MGKTNQTPDREINEPEDQYKSCLVCNGKGKIIVWDEEESEQSFDYEKCNECEGEGVIKTEPWEDDW